MPTYQYQCDNPDCNHYFEEMQSFTDKPFKRCPKCKKHKLRRLLGIGAGIIFKGGGWASDGYSSVNKASAPKDNSLKEATTLNKRVDEVNKKNDTKI